MSGKIAYHQFWRQTQAIFTEESDQAEWGNWYYATDNVNGLTYQAGPDSAVRQAFVKGGILPNTVDTNFRPINQNYPVFGYAVHVGTVGKNGVETLFTLGLAQAEAIQFAGANKAVAAVPSLWTSFYQNDLTAVRILIRASRLY